MPAAPFGVRARLSRFWVSRLRIPPSLRPYASPAIRHCSVVHVAHGRDASRCDRRPRDVRPSAAVTRDEVDARWTHVCNRAGQRPLALRFTSSSIACTSASACFA